MEQNGNGPKDASTMLQRLANIRRANEAELLAAKREGRVPVMKSTSAEPNEATIVKLPEKAPAIAEINAPSADQGDTPLMTSAEAAKLLGLSVKGLRNLASAGKVPHYKLFGHNRFKQCELLALLIRVEKKS